MTCILRGQGKKFRVINASAIPKHFRYMNPKGMIEQWDKEQHGELPEQAGLILVDTADENTTGQMKEAVCRAKEVFVIDHHEPKPHAAFSGIADPSSASTCELTVELADSMELIFHNVHPYTRSLVSAIPMPDPDENKRSHRIVIEGDVPSPLNPPSGCRFHTRCAYAQAKCREESPKLAEIAPGHFVACHLPLD